MKKKRNLLFICSDQHSKYDTGCYGNSVVITPNIDSLARDGTRFEYAYSNNPICVPARACIATGMYSHETGCNDNASPYTGKTESFGHALLRHGITMTTIGKLHYRSVKDNTGFPDQRCPLHVRDGIGDIYGLLRDKESTKPGVGQFPYKAKVGNATYMEYDEHSTTEAIRYLDEKRGSDSPWALYIGYTFPHFPLMAPEDIWKLYEEKEIPMPTAYKYEERCEHQSCKDHRHYYGMQKQYEDEVVYNARKVYYCMCTHMDRQIGIVLDKLREIGEYENTTIIYTSDHGAMAGNHNMWNKNCMLEAAVSIPMIVAGPEIPRGKVSDTLVSLVDIYPTVLDSLGIEMTAEEKGRVHGQSLIEIAAENKTIDRDVFSEYHSTGSYTGGFMLRHGEYKYIYYVGYKPQLFHVTEDPMDQRDLIDDPEYAGIAEDLNKRLRRIVDPEKIDRMVKRRQQEIVDANGGRENVRKSFVPVLFSPAPKV